MNLYLEHINQQFGETRALDDIDLTIQDGEFLAILGPSGCGKTTLLRAIAGFLEPTGGSIRLGETVYSQPGYQVPVEKRNIGMVFQSFALWPHMTVREHVAFPLGHSAYQHLSKEEKKAAVEDTIAAMGLTPYGDRYPDELSGGQRQRVSMARAIVRRPSLLLMDEPLSALDAELKISMRKEIQELHRRTGATVIYVTHDQEEAMAMADRILVMRGGHVEQLGTPEEIYRRPQTEFVATFVSKCNLISGTWQGNRFQPQGTQLFFDGREIPKAFRAKEIFPVRPEQFRIRRQGEGLDAEVTNRQYNGREIHYSLASCHLSLTVFTSWAEEFHCGEHVKLIYTA